MGWWGSAPTGDWATGWRLRGRWPGPRYKIKLKSPGFRLVYEVRDEQVLIIVIAVGSRDNVYDEL